MTIIVGANLTGLCTAIAFSKLGQESILIDKKDCSLPLVNDGRAVALSYGSKQILETLGIWDNLIAHAGPIKQIRVTDQYSPLFLHFNKDDTLGYLVEMQNFQNILYGIALKDPLITILDRSEYQLLENNHNEAILKINNKKYNTNLLIAADGKHSKLRQICNIECFSHNYHQTAIVCKVKHELPHEQIAQEMFLPSGPFAILPLKNEYESSIVWTEKTEIAKVLLNLDKLKFSYFLQEKFTDYLGNIEVVGPVVSHPLELKISQKYYHNRIMLIGDSAHSIHPIAGQGFNLAMRDINSLIYVSQKFSKLGLPLGCYQSLNEYQKLRFLDNKSMAIITDSLNKIFSNNSFPINILRKFGLHLVNQIPSLQNFFMEYAMAKLK